MWSQSHRYFVKTTKFETSQKNPSLRKFSLRFWPRLKSLINFPMNGAGFMILVLAGCKKGLVHVVDISKMELKPISPIDFIWFSECHLGYLLFDFMAKKHHSLITITLKAMKIFCWLLSTPPGQNSAGLALHTWPNKTKSVEKLCSEKKFIKVLRIYNFSDTSNSNQKWKKPPHSKKKKKSNVRRNHFCCEPESFLKVHTIDTIGLSPYLGRTTLTEKMGKIRPVSTAPSCSSLHHLRILFPQLWQENSQKNARILKYHAVMLQKNQWFQTQDNIPTSPCPNERPDHSPLAVGPRAGQGWRIHVQRPNRAREMWEKACYTGLFTKDSAHTQKSLLLLRVCKGRSSPGVRRNKIQKHIRGQHATVSQIRKLPLLFNFNCIPQIFRRSKFSKKYKKNDHGALKNFLMSLLKRRPKPTGMKPGASRNSSSVFLTKVRRFCCWIVLLNCRALSKGSDFCWSQTNVCWKTRTFQKNKSIEDLFEMILLLTSKFSGKCLMLKTFKRPEFVWLFQPPESTNLVPRQSPGSTRWGVLTQADARLASLTHIIA